MEGPARLLQAERDVARVLGETDTAAEAAPRVLEALCRALGNPAAALWHAPGGGEATSALAVWPPDAAPPCDGERYEIVAAGRVVGSIELAPNDEDGDREARRAAMTAIGQQLGRFLQQRSADSLHEAEARLRALLDASLDGVVLLDAAGRVLELSAAGERLLGVPAGAAAGRELGELLELPRGRSAQRNGLARLAGRRSEAVARPHGGAEVPVELGLAAVDAPGRVAFVATLKDLSERRRLEERLEAHVAELQEERDFSETIADTATSLERFFELSTDLLCTLDRDGRFTRVNPAFERGIGASAEQLVGKPLIRLVHRDDRAQTRSELRAAGRGRPTIRFENRCRRRDGSYRWLEWSAMADPGSRTVYAVARDVTEGKRAEERLRALAHEQAALRRVATLVAGEAAESGIFARVTEEAGHLLDAQSCTMLRFDEDGLATIVALWNEFGTPSLATGERVSTEDETAIGRVRRSGLPDRVDDYADVGGPLAAHLRTIGVNASAAAPIWLAGRLWGVTVASRDTPFPEGAEQRLSDFADLVAQALANADARDQLAASRARLVEAGDAERRRLERNLHDGAQQRLVALALSLRLAQAALGKDPEAARSLLDNASLELSQALEELRELARGIHPAVLSERGLVPALRALAGRAPIPVELSAALETRLPEALETAAYYVVSEALANIGKYARASVASICVTCDDGLAVIEVADDGVGGADASRGSGLRGLADRLDALNGRLEVESEPGEGTVVRAVLPCG